MEGGHWVSIFCKGGKEFYLDSYDGNENFLQFSTREWTRNEIELKQLVSDVCGDYCIYFLKRMSCMGDPNLNFEKI